MAARVLVAGIGNVFLGDDGFGVAVAEELATRDLPGEVEVADFGIRGMDLAYTLGEGYESAILVDAVPIGEAPGTIAIVEPDLDTEEIDGFQAHGMDPLSVLHFARRFGALPERTLVVGCQPQSVLDPDSGEIDATLSPRVAAAVRPAAELVISLIEELLQPNEQLPDQGGIRL